MYKIYFNEKPLFLATEKPAELKEFNAATIVIAEDIAPPTIKHVIAQMQQNNIQAGAIIYTDEVALFTAVSTEFTLIKAAGGLVLTPDNKVLFIFRRGKWDLPKGKLDEGESLPECAVREVKEETGLQEVQLQQPLIVTYHTYYQNGEHILKESHWYQMLVQHPNAFTPQTEEDIEQCQWIDWNNTATVLSNTHPSIIDVIKAAPLTPPKGKDWAAPR